MHTRESDTSDKKNCSCCQDTQETIEKTNEAPSAATAAESRKRSSAKTKLFLLFSAGVLGIVGGYLLLSATISDSALKTASQSLSTEAKDVGSQEAMEPAPQFTAQDLSGNPVSLSDFQGKTPVLVVFWATWCGWCAKELEDLKEFAEKHRDEIQILAIDSGESLKTVASYAEEKQVTFLMLLDEDRKIWNDYAVRGTPAHFLINTQGKLVTRWPGVAELDELESMLSIVK